MNELDELRTIKDEPILDVLVGESIEQRTGLPLNSPENLEKVIEYIEEMIRQFNDALKLLDDAKHLQAVFTLSLVIEERLEPSLQIARAKLENLVE